MPILAGEIKKSMQRSIIIIIAFCFPVFVRAQQAPRFRVIALYENGGHHLEYSKIARIWLDKLALDSNFRIDYIQQTDSIDSAFLSRYQLFIQLDYPPYGWTPKAVKAFETYMEKGLGGWIGFHHASLLGEFDGHGIWPWFQQFMGGIRWKNYIPGFASGVVQVESPTHPVFEGIPASFTIEREEWYTYDKSPRQNLEVLASVDESSYVPPSATRMGDHPVIWVNPGVQARNLYIFMGHSPLLFSNENYTRLFRNAISWAAGRYRD